MPANPTPSRSEILRKCIPAVSAGLVAPFLVKFVIQWLGFGAPMTAEFWLGLAATAAIIFLILVALVLRDFLRALKRGGRPEKKKKPGEPGWIGAVVWRAMERQVRGRSLARWQRWALAAGGPLSAWNRESFYRLSSWFDAAQCRDMLRTGWGIHDASDACRILKWLASEGHTREAIDLLQGRRSQDSLACNDPVGRRAFAETHRWEIEQYGLRAWDYGRMICVARWSYSGGLLPEAEAWGWLHRAARLIQESYPSWEEYGRGWQIGYGYWNDGRGVPPDFNASLDWLRTAADSPWRQLRWEEELSWQHPS